ncbi:MAG: Tyrosine-protein kinase YwqD [Lentisphaerae bacterium ADurb.Bin242]|nr:MAG: Tyrosine-protein kinase YwqD [Lentisphaerae bacterium ADurb.Bin242]
MNQMVESQEKSNSLEDFFCLTNILDTTLRYWKIWVFAAFFGLAFSFIVTKYFTPPVFMAKTTIYAGITNKASIQDGSEKEISISQYSQSIMMNSLLVNDYKMLLVSDRVQDKVREKMAEKFPSPEGKAPWFSVDAQYHRNTRIITILAYAHTAFQAQCAANITGEIFSQTVQDVLRLDNVKIIDPAKLPFQRHRPLLRLNLVLGFLSGLFLGWLAAFFLAFLDQTIKNPDQVESYLHQPQMGTIPWLVDQEKNNALYKCLEEHSNYDFVEALRLIRANLPYIVPLREASANAHSCRVFLITSTLSGEGKSGCTSSIAVLTAKTGKKVLLLDADLRKSTVERIFDLSPKVGLAQILAGETTLEQSILKGIVEPTFDVLPCGPIPPNPAELLVSESFGTILKKLREEYDYIFIDSPPALFLADPLSIAHYADAILFIVACHMAKIGLIRKTIRQISRVSSIPLSIIVNRFNRNDISCKYRYSRYGSYGGYGGYKYAYRASSKDSSTHSN